MKNFTIATVAILLFCISLFAQAPDTLWTKTYGGGAADLGNFVQQTADLGYIITGSTESFGAGNTDIYLIKTDSEGDTIWTKTYGGANADIAYCVQQTTDLGYIIVGQTASYGAGGNDVWLIKTNATGTVIWAKTYGGGGNDRGASVKQTNDGGYIISGATDSFGGPFDNVYIIKTNASGDTLWTRTWDSGNDDRGAEVQQTSDGGYIVTGHSWFWVRILDVILIKTNSAGVINWVKNYGIREEQRGQSVQETFDNGYIISAYTSYTGNVNPDFYLIKTNNLGDTIWSKTYGGPNEDHPWGIRQTADSGYIVIGRTNSFGAGNFDVWLVKTDQFGNQLWNKTIGGSGDDQGVSVQQTVDEGFIIAGRTNSFGAGNYDIWLLKLTQENYLIGWILQNSGTTNWLFGVSFTDGNHGTVVGRYGTILRTTNGGATWTSQSSGTTSELLAVSFTDENNGTAVGYDGYDGIILRTTNGGAAWTSQSSGTTNPLYGVSFTDANNGTAVGWSGTILRTIDGGITWTSQSSGTTNVLYGVSFMDENNGTAVGAFGTILRTTSGGTTWTSQSSGTTNNLNGVSFTDVNNGTAVGEGTILRTTDGGTTWTTQSSGTTTSLYGVSFTDANNGTVVGYDGTIIRTTNGGTTWTLQLSGTTYFLNSVSFTDENNGTVVGENGTILRTWNGGVPVELTSFTASVDKNNVLLNWATATELNNQGFEIERASLSASPSQEDWVKIGFVPGAGTTTEPRSYSFIDNDITPGKYSYRLKQIDYDGTFEYSEEVEVEIELQAPVEYALEQNYPNPFNPVTIIKYNLPAKNLVTLKVYNLLGEVVTTLVNEIKEAGSYQVEFDAGSLSSGIYFYTIKSGDYTQIKKMVLLK